MEQNEADCDHLITW